MTVIEEIAAERNRQRNGEGWDDAHDDEHDDGSLIAAAACYAYQASINNGQDRGLADDRPGFMSIIGAMWPRSWDWSWWKPKGKRRNLIRAAALIVAEVERMDRAEAAAVERHKSCTCGTPMNDVEMHEETCPLAP